MSVGCKASQWRQTADKFFFASINGHFETGYQREIKQHHIDDNSADDHKRPYTQTQTPTPGRSWLELLPRRQESPGYFSAITGLGADRSHEALSNTYTVLTAHAEDLCFFSTSLWIGFRKRFGVEL